MTLCCGLMININSSRISWILFFRNLPFSKVRWLNVITSNNLYSSIRIIYFMPCCFLVSGDDKLFMDKPRLVLLQVIILSILKQMHTWLIVLVLWQQQYLVVCFINCNNHYNYPQEVVNDLSKCCYLLDSQLLLHSIHSIAVSRHRISVQSLVHLTWFMFTRECSRCQFPIM